MYSLFWHTPPLILSLKGHDCRVIAHIDFRHSSVQPWWVAAGGTRAGLCYGAKHRKRAPDLEREHKWKGDLRARCGSLHRPVKPLVRGRGQEFASNSRKYLTIIEWLVFQFFSQSNIAELLFSQVTLVSSTFPEWAKTFSLLVGREFNSKSVYSRWISLQLCALNCKQASGWKHVVVQSDFSIIAGPFNAVFCFLEWQMRTADPEANHNERVALYYIIFILSSLDSLLKEAVKETWSCYQRELLLYPYKSIIISSSYNCFLPTPHTSFEWLPQAYWSSVKNHGTFMSQGLHSVVEQ